jgi:hypothetical protein
LNSYRLRQILTAFLVIAGGLLLLTGCQSLAGKADQGGGGSVVVATSTLNFGTVVVGSTSTLSDTITNNTSSSVTIDSIQGLNAEFQITGIAMPLVVAAGQSVSFNVDFIPTDLGDPTVTVSFDEQNSQAVVSLTATGIGANIGKLTPTPSPLPFGSIKVGAAQTSTVTLTNGGGTDLIINQATMSGAGFTMSNLSLPITLHGGSATSVTITFAPTGAGSFNGSVTFATTSDQQNSNVVLDFSGNGQAAGTLTPSPASLAFGNVQVGSTTSLSETLTNTGGSTVTINQVTPSGTGFSISGLSLPVTLAANQSVAFTTTFAPTAAGSASGTISVVSNASNSPLTIALSGTALAAGTLTANPSSASFGNVTLGTHQTIPVTVTNTGGETVTISSAAASGSGFSVTGQSLPITLTGGQSTVFNAIFTPAAAGSVTGALTISSNASNATLSVPLSGAGVAQGDLVSNPASFSFGNIQIGTSKSLSGTLTNTGGTTLTISAASASGTGFSLTGLTLPITLTTGQSTSFAVLFSPTASGSVTGSVSITSTGSDSNLSIPLSGAGVTQGTLAANPTSLAFGNVQDGSSSSLSETLTNTGGSSLTISAASASGTGFSISGLSQGLTLAAGQSTSFNVLFSPTASGTVNGSVSITSTGSNPTLTIPLSGTGMAAGTLGANPTSLAFGSVQVGNSKNLSETLTNTGGSTVAISAANVSGSGFSISGLSGFPISLTAGQSITFTATFTPASATAVTGSISVVSNASNSPLSIALSGTGTSAGTLAVSPTTLSFGNVTVGSSSALNGSLIASGASVTVQAASPTNGEFVLSGISLPVTIPAGQSATFTVTFTPQSSGATSASLSFPSNASNSPAVQTLNGTGVAATQHTVDLTWNASSGAVSYNVYRGTASGGPYTMINGSPETATSYVDGTVVSGQTYYYVATAVNSESQESGYSNVAQAVIPNP